jgi:hypothetical protein
MIFYVVAAGPPAKVRLLAPRLAAALEPSRLLDGVAVEHRAPSGAWAVAAISVPDPLSSQRLVVDGDALLVCNGPTLAADGNAPTFVRDTLRRYATHGSEAAVTNLDGAYNVVACAPSQGLWGCVDWSGLYPLYWAAADDVVVCSNRSMAVAAALGADGWDVDALGWVLSHVNVVGEHVPARPVRYVAPGYELRADWASGAARVGRASTWIWPAPSAERGRDNLDDREWDEVTELLVEHTRRLGALGEPLVLGLTGGKDSRLCLALASAAGLQHDVTTYTNGAAERDVAQMLAAATGFAHVDGETLKRAPAAPPGEPPSRRAWRRLRENVTRYEGIVGAWSALQNSIEPLPLCIKGFGGEFYRRGNDKAFRSGGEASLDDLARRFVEYHDEMDALHVVDRRAAKQQRAWLEAWVREHGQTVRADLLPEKFYVDHRLGHWSGPNLQSVPLAVKINPLAVRVAATKHLELSVAARSAERFHYEVMRRAAPALTRLAFFDDGWAPDIVAGAPEPLPAQRAAREPARAPARRSALRSLGRAVVRRQPGTAAPSKPAPAPKSSNQGWRFLDEQRAEIDDLFQRAGRDTPLGQIGAVDALRALVHDVGPIRKLGPARQLVNAVGVALVLLNDRDPVVRA